MRTASQFAYAMILALCALGPGSTPAWAWGNEGHQIVARIAAANLDTGAISKIAAILCKDDDTQLKLSTILKCDGTDTRETLTDAMAAVATWPDHLPGGKGPTEDWHFIDIGLFEGTANMMNRCPAGGCVVSKIDTYLQNLPQHASDGTWPEQKELEFMIHFFGDIHQPLHCATNADAGGNCETTLGFPGSTEMHAVWDTALVREVMAQDGSGDISATAAALNVKFHDNASTWKQYKPVSDIASESFGLARDKVYAAVPHMPTIKTYLTFRPKECKTKAPPSIRKLKIDGPGDFGDDSLNVVRQQLFKAGVRLASALNDIYL